MVLVYFSLLFIPVWIAEPETGLTARLLFWGIGWPLIVLGMMLFGRFWCGIFCPDGTLTEFVSEYGKNAPFPAGYAGKAGHVRYCWITSYGQMTGFYEYFPATLVLLGIPTCLALLTGYLYGNGKRVWCMYLCPGNGFFRSAGEACSFFHFRVDREKWKNLTLVQSNVSIAHR